MGAGRRVAGLAMTALLLTSCDVVTSQRSERRAPVSSPTGQDTRLIGLVGTLSGPDSWRGQDLFEGADVGISTINRGLAPGERRFELVSLDDRGVAARATRLVRRLAADERIVGIVYGGPPEGLGPVEPDLAAAGIPAVLCFGDLSGSGGIRPHIFQEGPPVGWEAGRVVRYLARDRDYLTVGALIERGREGRRALSALRSASGALGGPGLRVRQASYGHAGGGLDRALRLLRRRGAEAIVVQGRPAVFAETLTGLKEMGAAYRTTEDARIASAPRPRFLPPRLPWRPQVVGFSEAIAPGITADARPGTVATESYARGAHYLPVASLERFRSDYIAWWDAPPLGWELRSFEAVGLLGWAAQRAGDNGDADIAETLEGLRGARFGGLDVHFDDADHVVAERSSLGLWVIPRPGIPVTERTKVPGNLPWVPLARSFARPGGPTRIPAPDWAPLFAGSPVPSGPAPGFRQMRYGVTTGASDPVH
jgi:substrate-binding family protein